MSDQSRNGDSFTILFKPEHFLSSLSTTSKKCDLKSERTTKKNKEFEVLIPIKFIILQNYIKNFLIS